MILTSAIQEVIDCICRRGGQPFIVGGAVRDWLLGKMQGKDVVPKDIDIEVFGLSNGELRTSIGIFGEVKMVGAAFGVFKLSLGEVDVDISLPRRESKVGKGHKEFDVVPDAMMRPLDAARRRDYTMNALMWDPVSQSLLDFFDGEESLRRRVLRHVDEETFVDDPLRVLRGMQFCGRFGMQGDFETMRLCHSIFHTFGELSLERVWEEWHKWGMQSVDPRAGLQFLVGSGWIFHFPELQALIGCEQDPEWHPEGDVLTHSGFAVEHAMRIANREALDEHDRLVLVFASLCHDMGKPTTSRVNEEGKIISPGHADAGAPLAELFLTRIGMVRMASSIAADITPLVREHMCYTSLRDPTDAALRRLALRLAPTTIEQLGHLTEADVSGRPPHAPRQPLAHIVERAREINVHTSPMKPLLLGRHVLETFPGLKPGPEIGQILRAAKEAQIEGAFSDVQSGIAWLQKNISVNV